MAGRPLAWLPPRRGREAHVTRYSGYPAAGLRRDEPDPNPPPRPNPPMPPLERSAVGLTHA